MVNKVYSNRLSEYAHENGGRVFLLFLLFCLAIYQFLTAGITTFAIICSIPIIVIIIYLTFKYRMLTFWCLIFINYFVQMKGFPIPGPKSLLNEILQLLLLGIAIIDTNYTPYFKRCLNLMLLSLTIWCIYCTLEILNDTCGLGISIGAWYQGAR